MKHPMQNHQGSSQPQAYLPDFFRIVMHHISKFFPTGPKGTGPDQQKANEYHPTCPNEIIHLWEEVNDDQV
ncbi:MAG: hypothetical protein ACI9VN_003091 [Patescibacteria group bacterium]|jgi:hypothetical protein